MNSRIYCEVQNFAKQVIFISLRYGITPHERIRAVAEAFKVQFKKVSVANTMYN